MFLFSLLEIAYITKAILIGKNLYINNISVDTRKCNIKDSLYIIIKGNNDINFLCFDAIKKGALAILSDRFLSINISQLIVNDSYCALNKIVSWLRKNSSTKFLSLTGSTGKTSVKEITANILRQCGKTLYNHKNFNNEIGISYTLLKLYKCVYKYSILEFGADNIKDIDYLSSLVVPDVACITNLSVSHLVGFKNFFNIVKCKGKIFKNLSSSGIVILNDNYFFNKFWEKYFLNKEKIFVSFRYIRKDNYISIRNVNIKSWGSYFTLVTYLGEINIFIKLLGIHNIWNSLFSSALSISSSIPLKDIKIGLESCKPIKGRLYPIYLSKNKLILDDTYNSNPRSLYYSILFLQKFLGYKILVVGDMAELSNMSVYYHIKIGNLIKNFFVIDNVFSIGKYSFYISKFSLIGKHFFNINKLVLNLKYLIKNSDKITILIKGSRFLNMEKIINFF